MRAEKQFLVKEVSGYLDQSDYAVLIEYTRFTVAEVALLRARLKPLNAQFHVVKSSILSKAAEERGLPDIDPVLGGQIALVSGGDDVASIVKALESFFKEKDKGALKGAILSGDIIDKSRVGELRSLPTMDQARATLLAMLNTPATMLVRLIGTPSQQLVTVLDAFVRKNSEGEAA
ncbi:MAG: 50S ribosomal protein L10 [Opitutales bacterium]|jgi:large subunit ribosomal protein L10